jgi:hypothetical protein
MTLPLGQISMSEVNVELGLSSTALISLNDAAVRTLAGVGGAGTVISMQNLQGKSNAFPFNLSGTDVNLRNAAIAAGWNTTAKVIATITAPTTISSTSTGTPALTVNGAFPNGAELINNGIILGRGGNGGPGASVSASNANFYVTGGTGGVGGAALTVTVPLTLANGSGTIAGGGGGGGGGGGRAFNARGQYNVAGGGGGGGRGVSTGGPGGVASGGGGGNSSGQAGGAGTLLAAGAGGPRGPTLSGPGGTSFGGAGGAGGTWGSSGSVGGDTVPADSRGGPAGASGAAIAGNSNITYVSTGTRLGPVNP